MNEIDPMSNPDSAKSGVHPEPPPRPALAHLPSKEAIPAELRKRRQWVVWRYELRGERWSKVPYQANRQEARAKADDPSTWATFDEAMITSLDKGFDGIGFEFSADDPYFGLDVDNCLRGGEVLPWAAPILETIAGTYGEISPSGNGIKFIGRGKLPARTGTRRGGLGPDGTGALEVYDHGRYFAITGNAWEGSGIVDRQRAADELYALAKQAPAGPKPKVKASRRVSANGDKPAPRRVSASGDDPASPRAAAAISPATSPGAHDDDEVLRVASHAKDFDRLYRGDLSGFPSPSEADLSLMNRLAFFCGPGRHDQVVRLFLGSELGRRDKAGREDYVSRTVAKAYEGRSQYFDWAPRPNGRPGGKGPSTNGDGHHRAEADPLKLTEWGNARRMIAAHGHRLRYSKPLGLWLEWDGSRWRPDQTGAIWRWAKETVRNLGREAADTPDDRRRRSILRWALKSEEKKVMGASIELAWSEPGISIMPDELDRDPWVLNTPSGTVDLKTGELRPHRQEDLITKITSVPFDPEADCPRWKRTLREIFADDDEMVAYVQRALGYSLTGVIGEHALFLCHGTGRNGKNTVLDTVASILADYATVANPRTFLTAGQNDHLAMVADLMGRRFVPTDEVDEGEQLAESMVKRLTGNKVLKARFMHKNPFEFPVLFKVWMLANSKPEIQGQDDGIWSRIRLIPFEVYFPPEKRIKGLGDILLAEEGPGILKWLVDGCLEWRRVGLAEPAKVLDATKEYRSEQNVLMDFIGQCTTSHLDHSTLRDQAREKFGRLYERYVNWCKENGEKKILTSRKFGLKLTPLGYKPYESNGVSYRLGLTLKTQDEQDSDESFDPNRPF
jgi:putative DNA primase/helicase